MQQMIMNGTIYDKSLKEMILNVCTKAYGEVQSIQKKGVIEIHYFENNINLTFEDRNNICFYRIHRNR